MQSARVGNAVIFAFGFMLAAHSTFAQQEKPTYGEAGIWNLGLTVSGSFSFDNAVKQFTSSTDPAYQRYVSFNTSLFTKYFIFDGFHIGGVVDAEGTLSFDNNGDFVTGNYLFDIGFFPGYTLAISPAFQIDLSAKAGIGLGVHWYGVWNISFLPVFGGKLMFLFPVFENALIGCGYELIALIQPEQPLSAYDEMLGNLSGTYRSIMISHWLVFEISLFF